jgi:hypothetical protein
MHVQALILFKSFYGAKPCLMLKLLSMHDKNRRASMHVPYMFSSFRKIADI